MEGGVLTEFESHFEKVKRETGGSFLVKFCRVTQMRKWFVQRRVEL
jgi:hypothetical protein